MYQIAFSKRNMEKKAIEHLATNWCKEWEGDQKNKSHTLCISKLDGVQVDVKVLLIEQDGVWLRLVINSVVNTDYECDGENMYLSYSNDKSTIHHKGKKEWDHEMMCASIISIQKLIGQLKYVKMGDNFQLGDEYKNRCYAEIEIWSLNKNTEIDGDMCCVCHDRTTSETECGHHLCQQCWCSLKKEQENGGNGHKCPVCRKFMWR